MLPSAMALSFNGSVLERVASAIVGDQKISAKEAKAIAKTAAYFRWPPSLVRSALAYATAHPGEVERQRSVEIGA
jgi:hypothetical protein